jgi:hypothetical protein
MRPRWLLLGLLLGLVVGACGDGASGLTPEEQALADAIFADMELDNADDEAVAPDDMRCFAEGMVGALGVSRLGDLGVAAGDIGEPEDAFRGMTDAEMEEMADVGLACIDYAAGFVDAMEADGLSRSSAACLADRLDEGGFFRASFITTMRDEDFSPEQDSQLLAVFLDGAQDCLTEAELGLLFGG